MKTSAATEDTLLCPHCTLGWWKALPHTQHKFDFPQFSTNSSNQCGKMISKLFPQLSLNSSRWPVCPSSKNFLLGNLRFYCCLLLKTGRQYFDWKKQIIRVNFIWITQIYSNIGCTQEKGLIRHTGKAWISTSSDLETNHFNSHLGKAVFHLNWAFNPLTLSCIHLLISFWYHLIK